MHVGRARPSAALIGQSRDIAYSSWVPTTRFMFVPAAEQANRLLVLAHPGAGSALP